MWRPCGSIWISFRRSRPREQRDDSEKALQHAVRDTFRWLLSPAQEVRKGRLDSKILWEAVPVSPTAPSLIQEIEKRLQENAWLVTQWSPIHLANVLNTWYFREGITAVSALKVWQDCCHYLYLPRLHDSRVVGRLPMAPVAPARRTRVPIPSSSSARCSTHDAYPQGLPITKSHVPQQVDCLFFHPLRIPARA
jgi:hypothetical protein